MRTYLLTASQLTNLLKILGALVLDYTTNPRKPMATDVAEMVSTPLGWKDLPSLPKTIATCVKGGDKVQALYDLGAELKAAIPVFTANREYTTAEINLLKAFRAYLSTDSEAALNFIRKNANLMGSELASRFMPTITHSDHGALASTVKSLVGREGKHLTQSEIDLLKETNPKGLEKFAALRKQHTADFNASLVELVRSSGKKMLPSQQVYMWAEQSGFTHSIVPGLIGFIDEKGRWYNSKGQLLLGIPNFTTYSRVVMNDGKDPEAKWDFKAVKHDGSVAYGYTADFKRNQSDLKFQHVQELMGNINAIQANWRKAFKRFDITSKLSVSAVVLEILYSFAARVGSAPGRGVGTLLVKNSSLTQGGVNLAYLGKDSIPTKHMIKSMASPEAAQVVKALMKLRADKTPSSFLFTIEPHPGKFVRVTPSDINAAFHQFGASHEVTVHKLRTVRGTTLFAQLVEKDGQTRRPPSTQKDAMDRFTKMTEEIGKLLNHKRGVGGANESVTGTTASLNYIETSMQVDLFDRWGFRPPVALEKLLAKGEDQ